MVYYAQIQSMHPHALARESEVSLGDAERMGAGPEALVSDSRRTHEREPAGGTDDGK
jgi:hypothetical protein